MNCKAFNLTWLFINVLGLWLLQHLEIRFAQRKGRETFQDREENHNAKRKTESYVFSGFDNGIPRGWERKSIARRFDTGWFCTILAVRVPERFLISVRTKSTTENFVYRKLHLLLFSQWFNAFLRLELQHQRTLWFLFGDCQSFYFHSLIKSTFLVSKGLLCLYNKQSITGCW